MYILLLKFLLQYTRIIKYIVTPPSQPTVYPIDETVIQLSNKTNYAMSCLSIGATSYVWEKHPYGNIPLNINATGKKSKILTLINLQPHYEGSYRCLARNGSGNSYSNFTAVTIKGLFIICTTVYVRSY